MTNSPNIRPAFAPRPFAQAQNLPALPPRETTRWTARRKAEIIAAVEGGVMSAWEAADRYRLGAEEFHEWQIARQRGGVPALRATHGQQSRNGLPSPITV